MSDLITSQMLSDWRANYGLDKRTPIKAMHWWQDNMDGKAPAGVVAALGLCINEIERLTAERDKARAERDALADVLPGYYYMDPPDGGDASLLKQLERMSNDAARYRLLRRKFAIISDGEGHAEFCAINLPRPTYIAPNTAIELDTALDRERLGLDGAKRPPTPVGWSDTDWIKHLQEQAEQPHPLAGQHINQGSMDAAADAYEAEYYDALKRDAGRYRWLRNEASTARKCDPMVCIYPLDEQDLIDGDRLDIAIDAAMGASNE